jgi:serine/threonine-protein kinase
VHVSDGGGQPLSGAATQRRLLALLSVLAAAGDAGLSRDKLVGLLWPDVEPERARHSLTQSLYSARRALRDDDLFDVSAASVRLDATRITSDVAEFQLSLDRNELERAVELYEGPFLDGFFVTGAPEFETWSATQRTRLRYITV